MYYLKIYDVIKKYDYNFLINKQKIDKKYNIF